MESTCTDPSPCVRLVPSLVAPNQTVVVQPLFPNTRPLNERDLFVLQRTTIPLGQSWLYHLQTPNQPSVLLQLQMWLTPTLVPHEVLNTSGIDVPPPLQANLLDLGLIKDATGYDADNEAALSDVTGVIYGD